jgi:hypothetical protein
MNIEVMRILVYRKDILRINQIPGIQLYQTGSLWCECLVDERAFETLKHKQIWFEKLL